jgi:hypothetical protein
VRPLHLISFEFQKNGTWARKSVGKHIRQIFWYSIGQTFGGFIERCRSEDDTLGSYRVCIWTPAASRSDPRLVPLWLFVVDVLRVHVPDIEMRENTPDDQSLALRFMITNHEDDEEWSVGVHDVLDDDDVSDITIQSTSF